MRLARTLASTAVVLSVAVASTEIGCSLGLDASLIDAGPGDDGTQSSDAGGDGPGKPNADGHAPASDAPETVDAGQCASDSDCQAAAASAGACVSAAKCDPTWHVCMLTTCAVGACKAAVCNVETQTCSVPTTYSFEATQFSVQFGGVGAGARYSIAAVWPFVFILTTNGVVAYDVVDPTSSSPPLVPVHGVPFLPLATVAIGRRVYFVRGTEGGGPIYRQAIAWVDVPQNPLLGSLDAVSAWVGTAGQGVTNVLGNGSDGVFVVYAEKLLPTANVRPPIDDTTVLAPFANAGLASGAGIFASSGSRVVAYRYDSAARTPNFALVNGAATASAQTTGEQPITAYGPLSPQMLMASGDDGSVLWTTAPYALDDAGNAAGVSSARLTWLLGSGTAASFDTTAHVDLQTYSPPTGANVVGPPVWIDANRALGLAAASATSTDSTSVQVVTKSPPAVQAATRTLLSVDPGSVGTAASGGFAYVLAQDDPTNHTCSVYIFAPSCTSGEP
jgi:hypothetical protein